MGKQTGVRNARPVAQRRGGLLRPGAGDGFAAGSSCRKGGSAWWRGGQLK